MNAALLVVCSLLSQDLSLEQVEYLHTLRPAEFRLGEASFSLNPKHIKGDIVTAVITQTTERTVSFRDGIDPVDLKATAITPYDITFAVIPYDGKVWALNAEEKRLFDARQRTTLGVTVEEENNIRLMIALFLVCWIVPYFIFLDLSLRKPTLKGYIVFYVFITVVWGGILSAMRESDYLRGSLKEYAIAGCIAIPVSFVMGWLSSKIKIRKKVPLETAMT